MWKGEKKEFRSKGFKSNNHFLSSEGQASVKSLSLGEPLREVLLEIWK